MFGMDLEAQGTSAPQRAVSSTDELLRVKINNDVAGFCFLRQPPSQINWQIIHTSKNTSCGYAELGGINESTSWLVFKQKGKHLSIFIQPAMLTVKLK